MNGRGSVIWESVVLRRRNCMSRTSTAVRAAVILPDDARHDGVEAARSSQPPAHRTPMPRSAVAKAVGVDFRAAISPSVDDVDAGALHVADRDQRCVVLRLLEELLGTRHILRNAHAWHGLRFEHAEIDQPVGCDKSRRPSSGTTERAFFRPLFS